MSNLSDSPEVRQEKEKHFFVMAEAQKLSDVNFINRARSETLLFVLNVLNHYRQDPFFQDLKLKETFQIISEKIEEQVGLDLIELNEITEFEATELKIQLESILTQGFALVQGYFIDKSHPDDAVWFKIKFYFLYSYLFSY